MTNTRLRAASHPASRPARVRTWAVVALTVYAAGAAVVLVSPVSPEAVVGAVTVWLREGVGLGLIRQGWVEVSANVVLFFPVGMLATLALHRVWPGIVAAILLSASAEVLQTLLPGRFASVRDIVANVLGAALGSAAVLLGARLRRATRTARKRRDS